MVHFDLLELSEKDQQLIIQNYLVEDWHEGIDLASLALLRLALFCVGEKKYQLFTHYNPYLGLGIRQPAR